VNLSKTTEKAFDSARDASKLIITLSIGIIAFTVTFAKELGGLTPHGFWERFFLIVSWVAFLASAVIGIWPQLAMTEELDPKPPRSEEAKEPTINSVKITYPFRIQIIAFLLGIIAVVCYGAIKTL
jgi:hypothetical protein